MLERAEVAGGSNAAVVLRMALRAALELLENDLDLLRAVQVAANLEEARALVRESRSRSLASSYQPKSVLKR